MVKYCSQNFAAYSSKSSKITNYLLNIYPAELQWAAKHKELQPKKNFGHCAFSVISLKIF